MSVFLVAVQVPSPAPSNSTAPLIEWYKERERLEVVDGEGPPDEVTTRLIDTVERRREGSL